MPGSSAVERPALAVAAGWRDYALLDAGQGMKQERWGAYTLVRPDPQVIWPRRGGPDWREWDGYYHRSESGGGRWEFRRELPASWQIQYQSLGLTFRIQPTSFKHTGSFPSRR
jgi:23S rRNA (cytosine1962-C5)-methyltransferase